MDVLVEHLGVAGGAFIGVGLIFSGYDIWIAAGGN